MKLKITIRQISFILLCLSFQLTNAQKTYEFDYILKFKETFFKDSIRIKKQVFIEKDTSLVRFYLINSKNNSYYASVSEHDGITYDLYFRDEQGSTAIVEYLKEDLNRAEFVKIKCENVAKWQNPYKELSKDYAFTIVKDTLINQKTYIVYRLSSNNSRVVKRKKVVTQYYIIDTTKEFDPLFIHPTAYEEWKVDFPNLKGLIVERYFIDYYHQLHSRKKLLSILPTTKKIVIAAECDDTSK